MKQAEHNILPKMQRELHNMHISAYDTVVSAGCYYDGDQHGELIPCVFVTNEYAVTGIRGETVQRVIEKHIRHTEYVVECVYHPFFNGYRVMLEVDKERADTLNRTSKAFLDAFWQAIHDDPHARDNDAERAKNAGRAAVAALA